MSAFRPLPSLETLRDALDYDPATGEIRSKSGKLKFRSPCRGYFIGAFDGVKNYRAHRIAWKCFYGTDPAGEIDHINGDKTDNRIANLRDVSHQENGRNQKKSTRNTSGTTGVYWSPVINRWFAKIFFERRFYYLGEFEEKSEAIAARKAAEREHGFHPNHGRAA